MRKPAGYPSVGIDHYCPVMGISLMPKPFSDMVLATKMGGIDLNLHWPAKHVFHLFGEDSAREIGKNHLRWNNWSRRVERPPKLPHRSISTKFPLYPFYQEKDFLFPRRGDFFLFFPGCHRWRLRQTPRNHPPHTDYLTSTISCFTPSHIPRDCLLRSHCRKSSIIKFYQ